MDKRALKFNPLQPGDRVSVPRPAKRGTSMLTNGREIAEFLCIDPETIDTDWPEVIVRRPNGRLKRWPLWRIHLYIDEKYRREIRQLEADLEDARREAAAEDDAV